MKPTYGSVFMSESLEKMILHTHTHLFNDREYPRLAVVVTISADAEIDLLWEGICLVGCGKFKNATVMVSGVFRSVWCR